MENIFLNTDWHLYSKKHEPHHPYRSRLDLALLHDNIGKDMTENDLWVYLGDLCDPEVANRDMIRRILETIPAHKVLVRGNRDTEEDQWYLDLGFNQVTEGLVIHNMLFTHKPQPVPMDWINIHGDLHFEQISMDGTHINAFASNWNDACHPVLLDDLIRGAKIQKLQLPKFKSDKYRAQFHEDLETPSVTKFLDLTDAFQLYPVDESAGSVQTLHEILEFNKELGDWDYGVWNGTKLIKNPKDADYANYITMKRDQFARTKGGTCWDYVPYEIGEFAKHWPRVQRHAWNIYFEDNKNSPSHAFMTFQVGRGGWMLFEASDKMHRGIWCGGSEDDIVSQCFLWLAEVNDVDIKKTKAWATRYAPLELKWFGIDPQTYMDQLTKTVDEWKIDSTVELIPYGESVNEGSSLIESILFPDVETTKYFEADDNEYKRKAQKAEVDQDGNTAVTLDESDEAYGERIVAEQHQKLVEMVNSLEDSLTESTEIAKKQSNQSGPYQLFDMSLGYQKNPLFEGVQASSIDPNHKQNGHINLSHLKRVDVTKTYLAKHDKKGVLKDASPCTSTCKTVAWELDGRPIVTVAVGYQNKDHNWIGNMEVDPEFRGYGLGTQALKYAVDKLEGDALAVFKANKLAIQIYKDHGFVLKRPDEFKNKDYVQMVLGETTNQTISFKKGPGGHDQVHFNTTEKTKGGLRKFRGTLMAKDALYNAMRIAPQYIDRELLSAAKDMEDVAKVLSKIQVEHMKNWKRPADNTAYFGSMYYALMSEYDSDKAPKKSTLKRYMDLLPDLDSTALEVYLKKALQFLDDQMNLLTDALNAAVKAAGVTAAQGKLLLSSNEKELIRGFDALRMTDYMSKELNTLIYDFSPINRGIVIVGKECVNAHGYETIVNLTVKCFVKAQRFDYVLMCEGYKDGSGNMSIEPITYQGRRFTDVESLTDYIDPAKRQTFWILACNDNQVILGDNSGRIEYADDLVIHESALPVNHIQDAINDYVVRGELFRIWKGSVLKALYKNFPDMIAPQSAYMKVHVKATGLEAKIKTLGVANGKKYCKKIDNIVDLYANAISAAKVLLSIINGRYGHSMVDETVGNSLMLDFATNSDTNSIIEDANRCAFDPFNSTAITEEAISQVNAVLQPVLSSYSNLAETMTYLNLLHSPNSPLSMPSCVREGRYGGIDPFQVVTGTREPSRNPFAMEHFFDEAIATTASLDRGQKEDVADRYGLRDVGNTHEQEDKLQAELDAYKRKKVPTKAQLAKKREQDRLRYLKKARRVRKRKNVLRKIKKAFFPGVKNEAVDTVDNVDTESREIAEIRQEDTFGGDRKRYFDNKLQYANASEADDGPVIIEAVNLVRFFDRINEADTNVPHRSPIFVVSIADSAGLRIMMIGFSSDLKPAYALTFTENGTRARVLSVDDGRSLTTTGKISCALTLALGTDEQTKALRSRLDYYAQNRTKLKTEGPKDPPMLIAGLLGISDLPESYPLGEMDADYDSADIDRQVKSILGQKRIQERLEEGAIMNLHRSNPWQDQILEYQLGLVDEESFVAYLEKPKRIIRVDHSQINEPDYKEQNLEFEKRTKGKNYEANEIQRYHTIIGDAETV